MTDSLDYQEALRFAEKVVRYVGGIALTHFSPIGIETGRKDDGSAVTIADLRGNQFASGLVGKEYPGHAFIGEEGNRIDGNGEYAWILDPVDGTVPFAWGMPISVTALALRYQRAIQLGAIYHVFNNVLISASRGNGAFHRETRLRLPIVEPPQQGVRREKRCRICFDSLHQRPDDLGEGFLRLAHDGVGLPNYGSFQFAAAHHALGQLDGVVYTGTKLWDTAAPAIILEEAGARVTDIKGKPLDFGGESVDGLIAAEPRMHDYILETLYRQ